MTYTAPLRDLSFSLTEVAGLGSLLGGEPYVDVDAETVAAVLERAGEFAAGVLAPLNREGDRAGARFENGQVIAAPGFRRAYRAYREGGWSGLSADPAHGGQGLPKALGLAAFEMIHAANMSFGLCPMLSEAAIEALSVHGTDRQKTLYLGRLISGEWTGTMNLTEPQAGSDLSQVRTRAAPEGEGPYRLTGEKIFITWGDHDCADNILHLVLARLPDAPPGVRGVSLFVSDSIGGRGAWASNRIPSSSVSLALVARANDHCSEWMSSRGGHRDHGPSEQVRGRRKKIGTSPEGGARGRHAAAPLSVSLALVARVNDHSSKSDELTRSPLETLGTSPRETRGPRTKSMEARESRSKFEGAAGERKTRSPGRGEGREGFASFAVQTGQVIAGPACSRRWRP